MRRNRLRGYAVGGRGRGSVGGEKETCAKERKKASRSAGISLLSEIR